MLEVFSKIRRVAPHFHTALVTGESGTGKESAAKALHQLSPNPSGPFVVCNCAAVPENLFESELFGHIRGAFTGALQDKRGYVEAASGGTLFLDEITEVPLTVQAKLLRLLQNREIQRVGSSRTAQIELRIVAATNRDLRGLVADGKLREDLYYRLSMIEVKLPRLADRREDLPLLERHFLDRFAARYKKPSLTLSRRAQAMISRLCLAGKHPRVGERNRVRLHDDGIGHYRHAGFTGLFARKRNARPHRRRSPGVDAEYGTSAFASGARTRGGQSRQGCRDPRNQPDNALSAVRRRETKYPKQPAKCPGLKQAP